VAEGEYQQSLAGEADPAIEGPAKGSAGEKGKGRGRPHQRSRMRSLWSLSRVERSCRSCRCGGSSYYLVDVSDLAAFFEGVCLLFYAASPLAYSNHVHLSLLDN
jgi:hypothetical protein